MHDALTLGLPLLAIFAGILLNRQDVIALRNDLRAEIGTVNAHLDSIQRDLREFYGAQARHDVRISKLESK